jgi:hypothetical protein
MPETEEKVISMRELFKARRAARRKSLTLKVTIPANVVPLFKALVEVTGAESPESFAAWALCRGLTSEEAMSQFDDLVNELL